MIRSLMALFGVDPYKSVATVRALPAYFQNYRALARQRTKGADEFKFGKLYPCLADKSAEGGTATGHYFHQDLYVAQKVYQNKPQAHADIGSRVDGFVAHVAAFRKLTVLDIRKLTSTTPNINFVQCDIMNEPGPSLAFQYDSISCLHALEHFGLGRYGDPINYRGHLVGFANLGKLLKPGGKFYLSVPMGPQRIEFNAHRVFSLAYLLQLVKASYAIDSFAYVDDRGDLHTNVTLTADHISNNLGCTFGCGIFELTKQEPSI